MLFERVVVQKTLNVVMANERGVLAGNIHWHGRQFGCR